uniref:Uncharacterized protein n=1 Tax=Oryzias latipes TaxID=8090 RepID=A0A3P9IHK4_ORYLA
MTLCEPSGAEADCGELDPAPNPPCFSSDVITATMDYLSKCHSANHRSLVAILSKTPISIQRILLAVCERAAETTNGYERHRILLMYHLFVSLLLGEVKDGLGGAWAFVLRDVIYTLIHHINSRFAVTLFSSTESQSLYIILNCMNEALTQQRYSEPCSSLNKGLACNSLFLFFVSAVCQN